MDMMDRLDWLYNQLCKMHHLGFWYNQVYTMDRQELLYNLLVVYCMKHHWGLLYNLLVAV